MKKFTMIFVASMSLFTSPLTFAENNKVQIMLCNHTNRDFNGKYGGSSGGPLTVNVNSLVNVAAGKCSPKVTLTVFRPMKNEDGSGGPLFTEANLPKLYLDYSLGYDQYDLNVIIKKSNNGYIVTPGPSHNKCKLNNNNSNDVVINCN